MRFAGECYDGPWQGKHYASDWPVFNVAIYPPLPRLDIQPGDLVGDVTVYKRSYVWSRSLRKWCFEV
jgi:hypothetical protein